MLILNMYRKGQKEEFYTQKAHKEGYPARSVYKLKEIDKKYKIISTKDRVLDLGSAPGSWLVYLSGKVGSTGKVVGLDLEDIKINLPAQAGTKPNIIFYKKDILALTPDEIEQLGKFDAVLADLAPKTSGVPSIDAGKSLELCEMAFNVAKKVLKENGIFLTKIFDGEDVNDFIKGLEKYFEKVRRVKPTAVVKKSREFYILCHGFSLAK